MAIEGKSGDTQMATSVEYQKQEKEPSKGVIEKGVEIERKDEENGKSKNGQEDKAEEVVIVEEKNNEGEIEDVSSSSNVVEKSSSFREESSLLSELNEHEKEALYELRSKIEEAILGNKLLKKKLVDGEEKEKEMENEGMKEKIEEEEKEKAVMKDDEEKVVMENEGKEEEEKKVKGDEEEKGKSKKEGETETEKSLIDETEKEKEKQVQKGKGKEGLVINEGKEEEIHMIVEVKEKGDSTQKGKEKIDEGSKKEDINVVMEENVVEIDEDIALWGVPLFPRKGDQRTDVILLKFLRSREFRVNDAFEMLRNTLQWRKENNINSILDEDFGADLGFVAYLNGNDREGHPVCYNIFGVFGDEEVYNRTLGTEDKREKFLRWRIQLMEKGIQNLDFKPGGISTLLQINDLKQTPSPSKKELRIATKQAIEVLQDNYPEFVARNIFVNVPLWYYAFTALVSPFFAQRTKSKFLYTRPAKVTETLLKYIAAEEIPVHYGGLKQENDSEFSTEDNAIEVLVKAGSTKTIEIPAPEVGTTFIWDLTVLGWEVNYKEEFVPTNERSYTIVVQKGRKIGWQEGSVRNSFKNNEAGKVTLIIENGSFKKKRILYRYKTKDSS